MKSAEKKPGCWAGLLIQWLARSHPVLGDIEVLIHLISHVMRDVHRKIASKSARCREYGAVCGSVPMYWQLAVDVEAVT